VQATTNADRAEDAAATDLSAKMKSYLNFWSSPVIVAENFFYCYNIRWNAIQWTIFWKADAMKWFYAGILLLAGALALGGCGPSR
jgi:hypothetical protein